MTEKNDVNYTADMVAAIIAASPFDYEKAKELSKQLGRSPKSIVAKAQTIEGVEYIAKVAPPKKPTPESKKEVVESIEAMLNGASLFGLEKSTVRALTNLRQSVRKLVNESE